MRPRFALPARNSLWFVNVRLDSRAQTDSPDAGESHTTMRRGRNTNADRFHRRRDSTTHTVTNGGYFTGLWEVEDWKCSSRHSSISMMGFWVVAERASDAGNPVPPAVDAACDRGEGMATDQWPPSVSAGTGKSGPRREKEWVGWKCSSWPTSSSYSLSFSFLFSLFLIPKFEFK
jgi:hypothetical protein